MFKNAPVKVKAAGPDDGLEEGQFRALVSVFGNVDSTGDMVMPGAFTKTLTEWADSGDPIPVYWSHRMDDPDMNIGYVIEAKESDAGLEVLGQLDLTEGSPKAPQVYRLMKGRRTTQWSFAYDVIDASAVEKDGQSYQELRELKLYEVSTTPIGANTETELLAVKNANEARALAGLPYMTNSANSDLFNSTLYTTLADLKAGRTLSSKNETALKDAIEAIASGVERIKNVLASVASSDDGGKANTAEEQASGTGPATGKEPPTGATSKEPTRTTPVSTLAAHLRLIELEGDSHASHAG